MLAHTQMDTLQNKVVRPPEGAELMPRQFMNNCRLLEWCYRLFRGRKNRVGTSPSRDRMRA